MFWKKKSSSESEIEKLSGPKSVPGIVQQYLITQKKVDPEYAPLFKSVIRKNDQGGFDIRLYDESETVARGIDVKSYNTFDEIPDAVIFEGHYNESTKKVDLVEKNKFNWDTPIYTVDEIQKKIDALTQPGSTVYFFQARGGQYGGPLSKGCNIIELNPAYPGKKQKKYNIYTCNVVDEQPVGDKQKLWDCDKSKDVAKWVAEGHHKRIYS